MNYTIDDKKYEKQPSAESGNKLLINSSGGDIASTLDASYYKGCGLRQGIEREFLVIEVKDG